MYKHSIVLTSSRIEPIPIMDMYVKNFIKVSLLKGNSKNISGLTSYRYLLTDSTVRKGYPVEIVIAADYEGYYSNITRTVFVGGINREQRDIIKTYLDVRSFVEEDLIPRRKLIDIPKKVKELFENRGYGRNFLLGFVHGVGLLVEEDPITTIVPPHRQYTVSENMVLATLHSPLSIPGVGVIKYEDTYVIEKDRAKRITDYEYEIVK